MLALTKREQLAIARATDVQIAHALLHGGGWLAKAPAGEVQAVAAIVSSGLPMSIVAWRAILAPLGLSATLHSVFCHSAPQVSFTDLRGGKRTCELGDLLIVVDHKAAAGQDRMALLVQAKIMHGGVIRISPPGSTNLDWRQLDLYTRWPDFAFASPGYQPNRTYDLHDVAASYRASYSGRYGGIELNTPVRFDNFHPSTLMPSPGIGSYGQALSGMLVGRRGRRAVCGGTDDWSMLVDELLTVTFAKSTPASMGSHSRGLTSFSVSAGATGLITQGSAATPPLDAAGEEWLQGPISVCHLTIEDGDRPT